MNMNENVIPMRHLAARYAPDFAAINAAAMRELRTLLEQFVPYGRVVDWEYETRNPNRAYGQPGSFRVNLRTGKWSDFATGDKGDDPVSLIAFRFDMSYAAAAQKLAIMLGVI